MITFPIKSWREGKGGVRRGEGGREEMKKEQQQQQQKFWELCARKGEKSITRQSSVVLFLAKEYMDSYISPLYLLAYRYSAKLKVKKVHNKDNCGVHLLLKNQCKFCRPDHRRLQKLYQTGLLGDICPPHTTRVLVNSPCVAVSGRSCRTHNPPHIPPSMGHADIFSSSNFMSESP